jgi:hypothetical protein
MTEAPASPVLAAALRWCRRGAVPIPVRFRDKAPVGEEWQKQRFTVADVSSAFKGMPLNIGVLWGAPSGNVIDVDLDWPEACAVAGSMLPATAIYGRASSQRSHWLYRVPDAITAQWLVPKELVPDGRKAVVLELRAGGTQSVVPPSTHPSGELYAWVRECKPRTLDYAVLVRRLNLVAAGAVLVRHWCEGVRHHIALALAGAALSSGYAANEVEALIIAIAEAAGDPEARDRARAVPSSAAALATGRPATGVPKLAELLGEPVVAVLKRWLGLANAVPAQPQSSTPSWSTDAVLSVRSVADIEEKPMHWLWPNRIARGKLHMVAGEPGLSKSVLTCALAGIVSSGGVWPLDGTRCESGDVLMLNVEDDPADTIRPRLRAAGADLARVALIEAVHAADGKQRGMTLADVDLLERYLQQQPGRFVLLTCDPIGALMADRDTHRDSDVRSLLAPLAALAMRHELAVLLVAHLNKSAGVQALHRIVGSIGFAAAVRMVYFLARDHDNDARLLLVPGKANLAPMGMAGLSYELESVDLGGGIVAPRIRWHDVPEMRSANEVLSPPANAANTAEQSDTEAWLRDRLAAGPVLVRAVQADAETGIDASWRTIKRAAQALGVIGAGEYRSRTWALPGNAALGHQAIGPSGQVPAAVVPMPVEAPSGQGIGSFPDGLMAQWPAAGPPVESAAQQALLPDTVTLDLHPCTDCAHLNVGNFCAVYQRVLPEPSTPNACVRFERRRPDVPW